MLPTPERTADWLAAVARRNSRRTFDTTPAAAAALDDIEALCQRLRPYPDARVVLVREPAADIFKGIIGSYGKVTGSPHALLFIADKRGPFADQHLGYTGEAVVLEATAQSLSTCWIGGFFDPTRAESLVSLTAHERILAVSPLGVAASLTSGTERAMTGMAGSSKRKPLDALAPAGTTGWPTWAVAALETARLAPSAVNRQPWRFRWDDAANGGSLVISADSRWEMPKVTKRLDCGIAMLHVEIAALSCGVIGSWTDLSSGLDVARFSPAEKSS